jgi:hypothetical protein
MVHHHILGGIDDVLDRFGRTGVRPTRTDVMRWNNAGWTIVP